jgi:protein TonB
MRNLIAAIGATLLVTACAVQPPAPPGSSSPPEAPLAAAPSRPPASVSAAPSAGAPRPYAKARTQVDAYKQSIGLQILERNVEHTFEGVPPHLLRAVIVLQFVVDGQGHVTRARVLRAPSAQKALEPVALASLQRAGPFPAPPRVLLASNSVELFETWLFRADGKFQIRSIAQPQETLDPNEPLSRH